MRLERLPDLKNKIRNKRILDLNKRTLKQDFKNPRRGNDD